MTAIKSLSKCWVGWKQNMPKLVEKIASHAVAGVIGLSVCTLVLALVFRWPLAPAVSWSATSSGKITAIVLSAAGDRLTWGDVSGQIVVHAARSGREIHRWKSASSPVTALARSPNDRILAVAHEDGSVSCHDAETGELLLQQSQAEVCVLQFSPDGRSLALASQTGELRIVNILSELIELDLPVSRDYISAISFSPDSKSLSVAVGRAVEVWRIDGRVLLWRSRELTYPAVALDFSSDGSEVVAFQSDKSLTRWRFQDGCLVANVSVRHGFVYQVAVCPGSQLVAVASMRGGLHLHDTADGSILQGVQERGAETLALSCSGDSRWLAAIDDTQQLKLWKLADSSGNVTAWRMSLIARRQFSSWILVSGLGLCLALTMLAAVRNWPDALIACLVLEFVRDPIRKLGGDQSLGMYLSVSVVWLLVAVIALYRSRTVLSKLDYQFPELRQAALLLVLAMIPGAVVSLTNGSVGWALLAAGGATSYLIPLLGVVLGAACVEVPGLAARWLVVFAVTSTLGALTALPESMLWNVPGLGGMDFVWYRSFPAGDLNDIRVLPLISGIYRSPDALGLHAALGLMFIAVLLTSGATVRRWPYVLAAIVLTAGLLLSGRRKMIALPVIFGLFVLLTGVRRPGLRRIVISAAVTMSAGIIILLLISAFGPYPDYVRSLVWDGWPRVTNSLAIARWTIHQSGFWGAGLGVATQGVQRFVEHDLPIWQEDGLGRALVELGIPGTILALTALAFAGRAAVRAWRKSPHSLLIGGLLGMVLANLTCFFVSHQIYSGDPAMLLLTSMCLGIALWSR